MGGLRSLLFACVFVGCVDANLVPCGDLLCPSSSKCVAPNVCATDAQLAACEGLVDGALCLAENIDGSCSTGVCVYDICDDGQLTGGEPCDADQFATTCADLGFYEGTPTCTPGCSISTTGCSQECGDGTVQVEHGEQCDESVPDDTCVGYGRDYGRVSCNEFCAPAIPSDCRYLGWPRVFSALAEIDDPNIVGAAANARGALLVGSFSISSMWDGVGASRAFQAAVGTASTPTALVVFEQDALAWFDGTWHSRAIASASTGSDEAFSADADAVYRVRGDTNEIERFVLADATSDTVIPSPPAAVNSIEWMPGYGLFVGTGSGVYRRDTNAWTRISTKPSDGKLARAGAGRIANDTDFFDLTTTPVTRTSHPLPAYQNGTWTDDGDYVYIHPFAPGEGLIDPHWSSVQIGRLILQGESPGSAAQGAFRSGDGRILSWGEDGLFEVAPRQFASVTAAGIQSITPAPDGSFTLCGAAVYGVPTGGRFLPNNEPCRQFIGDPNASFLAASATSLWFFDGAQFTREAVNAYDLAGDLSRAVAITAANGLVARNNTTGVWTPITTKPDPSCNLLGSAGTSAATIRLLWVCAGGARWITDWDGSAFTTLLTTDVGLTQLTVAPDGAMMGVTLGGAIYRIVDANVTKIGQSPLTRLYMTALGRDDMYWNTGTNAIRRWTPNGITDTRATDGVFLANPRYYAFITSNQLQVVARAPELAGPDGP